MNWHEFPDRAALTAAVTDRLQQQLTASLAERPTVSMALSGGSTPKPIYARLASLPLDWARVTAVPTDERWVGPDHAASNVGEIRRQFARTDLDVRSLAPDPLAGDADPHHAERVLSGLPKPFDLAMIGMGGDGHFASLFPGSPALAAGLDPKAPASALAVTPDPLPPEAPFSRISLTLARLLQTRCLLLVITGEAKREVLQQAARIDADEDVLPVAALLRAAGERLEVFWSP